MNKELSFEKSHLNYTTMKMARITIRTTYYILCMRNKPWTDPELSDSVYEIYDHQRKLPIFYTQKT